MSRRGLRHVNNAKVCRDTFDNMKNLQNTGLFGCIYIWYYYRSRLSETNSFLTKLKTELSLYKPKDLGPILLDTMLPAAIAMR